MAIVKLGPTVVGIRGTVGGLLFSANKSGPFARAWSRGGNPRTPFQTAQRSVLSSIPSLWRALSGVEQAAWDTWAALPAQDRLNRLGETISISGFNWFSIINIRLLNMGRADRSAVPTQSRPSAPTLSSLVLPFLPQQATKITYPSGTFDPDFDQVIEIAVAISVGRTIEPTSFLLLRLDTDPPDTDQEFVGQYLERWNLTGASVKGFARLFRQTTDGLRSSPGTASFISSDTPPFAAIANDYNGSTNRALRGGDLTGNVNTKQLLAGGWFRIDGGDGTVRTFLQDSFTQYALFLNTDNTIGIFLRSPAGPTLLSAKTTSSFPASATWHQFLWSVDLSASSIQLVVDGVLESPVIDTGPINDLIDYTSTNHTFGATTAPASFFDGCLSQFYFNPSSALDLSIAANIARFVDRDGFPVDLGDDGSFPTGAQPIIYFASADPETNLGFGGNYVNQAALSLCSSDPP